MGNGAGSVLVVDDSPTVRLHLRVLLEEAGFEVAEAGNGLEGLEEARRVPFSAIVVDINMPLMNGFELIASLRQLTLHRETPIFVASTEASDEAVQRGINAGATAWLTKPVDPELLVPVLRRAVQA
jgi:two-component system chemotaxis response regulator CheY